MTGSQQPPAPLPARPPADDETEAFGPRFPWKYAALIVALIVLVVGGYLVKEARRAAVLRAQIASVHKELDQPRERYFAFRNKVEKLVLGAAGGAPASAQVDKRLRIEGLRSGRGMYLRLRAQDLKDPKAIAAGAAAMDADVINACMGLAPVSARALWRQGEQPKSVTSNCLPMKPKPHKLPWSVSSTRWARSWCLFREAFAALFSL